ncbi:hypothetical protein N7530_008446 [Penicillium desertorum]|uniref:Uncharacterized protein n=1 Tax=Penicillium desertorum TaxID=1303715 RepID=A0A9W9WP96_9EURO|nr:hypothetical protein N7530_008446 [Penicillium desertorum]
MILSFLPDLFTPPILQKRAAPLVWVFLWACSILISLAIDLGWPPALLYGLIGIAEKRRPDPGFCAARHGDSQTQCEVIGNPDFYGLGIRLGIYLQWFSALLALPAESKGFFQGYFVFTFALFVMFFVLTFGETASSCVFTVELIIMQFIFFGGMYIMVMARIFRKAGAKTHSGSGLVVAFELLLFPIVLYGCWFWIRLAQRGNVNPFAESPCGEGTTFFLLARVTPQRMRAASGFMAFVFVYTQLAILFFQLGRAIGFFGPLYGVWVNRKYISSSADAESAPQPVLNATQQAPSISGSQRSQPSLTPSQRRIVEVVNLFDDADAKLFTQAATWMVFIIPSTCYMVLITGIVQLVLRVTRQENKPWAARLYSAEDGGKEGPGRLLESM